VGSHHLRDLRWDLGSHGSASHLWVALADAAAVGDDSLASSDVTVAMFAGYASCSWEGRRTALFSGGVDGDGNMVSDIFLMTVGPPASTVKGSWRVLAEWPSSIFQGEGFTERCAPCSTLLATGP
jgi:hypothetical protein